MPTVKSRVPDGRKQIWLFFKTTTAYNKLPKLNMFE